MKVPQIESYRFGHIVIDGQSYTRDVILLADRVIPNWWRKEGHALYPEDLAAVADGAMQPYEPQPYATVDVGAHLFRERGINDRTLLMSCAFDDQTGTLYALEPWADSDRPIVHAWRVK